MGYKEDVWNWLITYGGAVRHDEKNQRYNWGIQQSDFEDYYGCRLRIDYELTFEAAQKMRDIGVDYEASSDPASHVGNGFNGTFTETQLKFYYFFGTLVLKDGSHYYWGSHVRDGEDLGFAGAVRLITQQVTLEEALDKLEDRLTERSDAWTFAYYCRLPKVKAVSWVIEEE